MFAVRLIVSALNKQKFWNLLRLRRAEVVSAIPGPSTLIMNVLFVTEEGVDEEEDGDWVPPTASEKEAMQRRMEQRDKASEAMAAKMLAGWALLDAHCPKSNCVRFVFININVIVLVF